MKKSRIFFLLSSLFLSSAVFALEVNEKELETVSPEQIVFENYSGPHSVINTADEISGIGSSLGKTVAQNLEQPSKAGSSLKYQIIHAVDSSEKGKLDADILVIGQDSTVDHIKNIRRIISAYLSQSYGYSKSDADTLAVFATVYNAVYRGNFDYFETKYKKAVTSNLMPEKAGIALSYKEWPGKTQIVIPLNDINGGLSTVDTSVISDRQVVKSMQGEDDKGVEARKDMVDIKEREAENAQEKASSAQKKAVEESNKLKETQEEAKQAKDEAAQAKKEAEQAQKKAEENPQDKEAVKQAEEKQAVAEEKQAVAEEKEEEVKQQAEKTEQAKEEAAQAQSVADTKRTEAQNERKEIAQDQQQIIKEENENKNAEVVWGLKNVDDLGVLSELVKLNSENGKVIKESPVTVIRSRTIYETENGFIGIAGTTIGTGAVKLVILDKDNMEIIKESTEEVSENSVLVESNGEYYCIIKDNESWCTGKFNSDLQLLLKSPVQVKQATPITITQKGILVTDSFNRPALLKLNDLSKIYDEKEAMNAK